MGMSYLRHGLVVNVDQFPRVGVDLQCAVEAERGFDVVCAYMVLASHLSFLASEKHTLLHHTLSLSNLLHEVGLNLLWVLGEALLVCLRHSFTDSLLLRCTLVLSLLLCSALCALALLFQCSAEFWVISAPVIEVDGVCEEACDDGADADGDNG